MKSFEHDWSLARKRMINVQLIERNITDLAVLKAMEVIPRHRFVAHEFHHEAYDDHPVPIGFGQTISQPYIVALMTQLLRLNAKCVVLEIGTGCGYQTAVLARLCKKVHTIEIVNELQERARQTLAELDITNVEFLVGDGNLGWPGAMKFDRILCAASASTVPARVVNQLRDGGRMILPVGIDSQVLTMIERTSRGLEKTDLIPVRFVPLVSPKT